MPADQAGAVLPAELAEGLHRKLDRLVLAVGEQREKCLGQPGQVPFGDDRLVAVCVPPAGVDGAVHGGRVECLHEGAWPVVDGFAGDRHVVGVHHPVDESDQHPAGHQVRLGGDHPVEEGEVGAVGGRGGGEVAGDRMVGEPTQEFDVVGGPRVLKTAHPQMAAGDPGEHRPRQFGLPAHHRPVATTASERVLGMPSACIASLTTYSRSIGPDRGQAVATAGERGAPGTLQVQVAKRAVGVDELAEQERPPVAQTGGEAAELVPGVGLRHRGGVVRDQVADQKRRPSAPRSQVGSRPSSAASGSFSASSRGSRTSAACQGRAISESSPANRPAG